MLQVLEKEQIRVGVVGNISACHADAPGSIPGHGALIFARFPDQADLFFSSFAPLTVPLHWNGQVDCAQCQRHFARVVKGLAC